MTNELNKKFEDYFQKLSKKFGPGQPLQVLLKSEKLDIDFEYSNIGDDQPFHIASIGKIFTATVIGLLCDEGSLRLEDKIIDILDEKILENLFVYKGVDYKSQITIKQLLTHTSGVADYFEGPVTTGLKFLKQIMGQTDLLWNPQSLVNFTRDNQTAFSAPGKFNYSDTGYILIGMIIEKITGKSFGYNLKTLIFDPLGMNDSYLMFCSEPNNMPKKEIANIWLNGVEISKLNMMSCDWSGGGIISTTKDLLKFQQCFRRGYIISKKIMQEMDKFENKFRPGIFYGLGMMELRFEGFFFLIRGLPKPRGHIGILSTHLFYDIENDLHIVMNFGSDKRMVESFKALVIVEQQIKRYLNKNGLGK